MVDFIVELPKKQTHSIDRPKKQWWILHVDIRLGCLDPKWVWSYTYWGTSGTSYLIRSQLVYQLIFVLSMVPDNGDI